MEREKLKELYKKYELTEKNIFKHKHYLIVTRSGIEKIQAIEKITVKFEVIRCEHDFAVFKAKNPKTGIETFGSAKHGDFKTGNTNSWYIAEIAEKRALSRLVLKQTGFYELGVFGEDESVHFDNNDLDRLKNILNDKLKYINHLNENDIKSIKDAEKIINNKDYNQYKNSIKCLLNIKTP